MAAIASAVPLKKNAKYFSPTGTFQLAKTALAKIFKPAVRAMRKTFASYASAVMPQMIEVTIVTAGETSDCVDRVYRMTSCFQPEG